MTLNESAFRLVESLRKSEQRLVLAESCTGGLAAATLTAVPGVSSCFCGSAVTYRESVKQDWIGVDEATIAQQTAVCADVAIQMSRGVLSRTREATIAAAITGHVGPDAPADLDGIVFISIACRRIDPDKHYVYQFKLKGMERTSRQLEATELVFRCVYECLPISAARESW